MLRVLIFSDLHIDNSALRFNQFIKHLTDYKRRQQICILAGDIGSVHHRTGKERLAIINNLCRKNFQHTLMIMGNHEHYYGSIDKTKSLLQDIGFTVLDRDIISINGLTIAGCTLWSDISNHIDIAKNYLSDFRYIKDFSIESYQQLHRADRDFLAQLGPVDIVVTHHAPLLNQGCSPPRYLNKDSNCCFETDLSDLVSKQRIWICGHTHHRTDFTFNGCRVVMNCIGYPKQFSEIEDKILYL